MQNAYIAECVQQRGVATHRVRIPSVRVVRNEQGGQDKVSSPPHLSPLPSCPTPSIPIQLPFLPVPYPSSPAPPLLHGGPGV